jgi:hypothetical protein
MDTHGSTLNCFFAVNSMRTTFVTDKYLHLLAMMYKFFVVIFFTNVSSTAIKSSGESFPCL